MQPLPVPTRSGSFEELSKSTAVQLFVERAKLHKPSFAFTEREAPAVADLVYRLEGIPLALELAAARVRSLSVADINKRLNDRYKLLTGGDRTLQARQQTLRALVDWSYDLLEEGEQVLLARMSVFAAGFELAAVEAICGADPITPDDVLDLITSLVEKSLLRMDDGGDGARYRMLETIREYANEKLVLRDEQTALRAAHCDYFLTFAKAARPALDGPDQADWTLRVEGSLDDLRAAIKLALDGGVDPIVAVKFEVALLGFWMLHGYATEGRNYVRAALALPAVQASDIAHAHALYVGGGLADSQSDHAEARRMLEQCLQLRRRLGNAFEIAATLSTLSLVRLHTGDASGAREGETEAAEIFREMKEPVGQAIGLLHLGQIDAYIGEDAEASSHLEECLAIARNLKYSEVESECELMLGQLALDAGDRSAARARFARALEICQDVQDKRNEATALWALGKVDLVVGDHDAARSKLGGAMRAFQAFEMFAELLGCLEDYAELVKGLGHAEDAVRLCAAIEASRQRLALPQAPRSEQQWKVRLVAERAALGPVEFDRAWTEGQSWELQEAVQFARSAAVTEAATA